MTLNGYKYAFSEIVLGCEILVERSSRVLLNVSFSLKSQVAVNRIHSFPRKNSCRKFQYLRQ